MARSLHDIKSLSRSSIPTLNAYGIMDAEQLWSLCTDEASKAGVRKILDVSDEELKNITNEIEKSIPPGRIDRLKKKPGQFYTGARNPNKKPKN